MDGTLHLDHARLSGTGAAREPLAAALAGVTLPGLCRDETLYIPRHRSRAILRPQSRSFAATVSAELDATLAIAMVDPPPGTTAPAYRFTTRTALAIWLLGTWVRGDGQMAGGAAALAAQLPGGSVPGWARRAVFGDGRSLPAVLAGLARQGLAAALVARLDLADVAQIRQALAYSHGLPPPLPLARCAPDGGKASTAPEPAAQMPTIADTVTFNAVATTAATARAAGNDLAALPPAAAALLLAVLHLDADPAVPRAALVAAAGAVIAAAASPQLPRAARDMPLGTPPLPRRAPPSPRNAPASTSEAPQMPRSTPAEGPRPVLLAVPSAGFASDFAGAFFLLNAFLAMGLYPDFTRPADRGLATAPSRLLDRLAALWFGPRYHADRLHRALAPATTDPALPNSWQVAPVWLAAFDGDGTTTTTRTARYLTHWHAEGFPLLDVRLRSRQARHNAEKSRYYRHGQRLPSAPQARWLACLGLYLDARIRRATDDPALGLASLAIPGQCRVSADRIDIDIALAALPLPLRLAGLDRDPGWLPAEGRTVAFHFQ